jgi:hypothetical protein
VNSLTNWSVLANKPQTGDVRALRAAFQGRIMIQDICSSTFRVAICLWRFNFTYRAAMATLIEGKGKGLRAQGGS